MINAWNISKESLNSIRSDWAVSHNNPDHLYKKVEGSIKKLASGITLAIIGSTFVTLVKQVSANAALGYIELSCTSKGECSAILRVYDSDGTQQQLLKSLPYVKVKAANANCGRCKACN